MGQSFEYVPFNGAPYAASVAELLARAGDPAARAAIATAQANGRAREISGQAYAGAAQNIGNTIAAIPGQMQQQKDLSLQRQVLQGKVNDQNDLRAGQKQVNTLLAGDQLKPGDAGPRQESYLDSQGLFDVPKLSQALASSGYGHLAPELLKGAESINDSITKHQQTEAQLSKEHAIMLGDLADSAIALHKSVGMPLDGAMDFVVRPALATKRIQPQEYQQVRDQIAGLPPDQQIAALGTFRDQAAKLSPMKTLAEGAKEIDRYGRTTATGGEKPPTEAEIALKAAGGDPLKAMGILKPAAKRTEQEQALDAFAKTVGKTKAEDLTDAERQAFVKRDAETKATTAFAQHQRERNYDVAHPVPVKGKSQDELEQEARGVLQREFSSRSGGMGTEDGKVNQAVHLIALMDQYEGKPMPAQIHAELAMGLAKLTSPNGQVGVELEKEFKQKTAAEGLSKGIAYLTGDPTLVNATPEKLREMLRDSITRQGTVAEQNRQTYLDAMLKMLPTQLDKSRRDALAQSVELNRVPLSRLATNAKGETRRFTSTDGGKTWK